MASSVIASQRSMARSFLRLNQHANKRLYSKSLLTEGAICKRQALQLVQARSLSTHAELFYNYATVKPVANIIPPPDDDDDALNITHQQFLALSPARQRNILQRIWHWISSMLHSAYDGVILTKRLLEIVVRLAPLTLIVPVAMLMQPFYTGKDNVPDALNNRNVFANLGWSYFKRSMQKLGPCFVKLCQWVATRRDIFPPNVCDRLAALHDQGYPHKWSYSQKVLQEAFGEDYEEKGLLIQEKEAFGCGSAAQVYRGTLKVPIKDDKNLNKQSTENVDHEQKYIEKRVAIKILHPKFDKLVERDLWLMMTLSGWLHHLPIQRVQSLNLPYATKDFGAILQRQSDLRVEAANLQRFGKNFGRKGKKQEKIMFPQPMEGWIDERVIVEDLVEDARPIATYLKDETADGKKARKELAGPLLRAFLKMVFWDNFVHGDVHPGNVLVKSEQVKVKETKTWFPMFNFTDTEPEHIETQHTIVFLDAGIASSLTANDMKNLLDLFRAVITNQGEQAGRLMIERARSERMQTPENTEAFAKGIGELVEEFHDNRKNGLTLAATRIGSLLSRVLDLCRIHGVEIDPAMASIVISTLVLEGLGRSLDPDMNLMDSALPFVLNRGHV